MAYSSFVSLSPGGAIILRKNSCFHLEQSPSNPSSAAPVLLFGSVGGRPFLSLTQDDFFRAWELVVDCEGHLCCVFGRVVRDSTV